MDVNLIVLKSEGGHKTIGLKPGTYTVGRGADATLRVPLPSVSRAHCEITINDSEVSVRDLGSSNGTFRNRDRVTHGTLRAGDLLSIGECNMLVQINGEPAEMPAGGPQPGTDALAETPPAGSRRPVSDSDETVSRPAPGSRPLVGKADDSSILDFDFDFEDDDNPKL